MLNRQKIPVSSKRPSEKKNKKFLVRTPKKLKFYPEIKIADNPDSSGSSVVLKELDCLLSGIMLVKLVAGLYYTINLHGDRREISGMSPEIRFMEDRE